MAGRIRIDSKMRSLESKVVGDLSTVGSRKLEDGKFLVQAGQSTACPKRGLL